MRLILSFSLQLKAALSVHLLRNPHAFALSLIGVCGADGSLAYIWNRSDSYESEVINMN
jgi:hypothetical protein